ncbi:DUF58 domain-containing protein [Thermoproteus tenax]|uniref:Uncharacterized conserved protein with vWA domain n=1 Tax=Thermoproteus tenax (strain ATCC 35583 / DSM 2078 / JCM 9277 / NBRC 100435 / Kra 1) TaxID=768679 RepID=G4RN14_THETK|nr:DUF58 domain-containing protein [Thermoproteus tenax]CCC80958.1 uncharacterized conserved protein with vWA domain [Thermoproteus tenax Kra 1]
MREGLRLLLYLLVLPIVAGLISALTTSIWLIPAVLFPAIAAALLLLVSAEPEVKVSYQLERNTARIDDEVKAKVRVEARRGFGILLVRAPPIPGTRMAEAFEVAEGNNVFVFFKGLGPLAQEVEYKLKPVVRGRYELGAVEYSFYNALHLHKPLEGRLQLDGEIQVLPRVKIVNRILGSAKPRETAPRLTASRLGPYSTEFKSIRRYIPGDPYKFINWKATARSPRGALLVNEYEREGLRTALILLDAGSAMMYGTLEENPLEYGISLALSLARALLRYGYNVGLWVMPKGPRLMPSSGSTQYFRILRALLLVRAGAEGAYRVDGALKRILNETKPAVIFITNLTKESAGKAVQLAEQIKARMLLVDVTPESILAGRLMQQYGGTRACGRSAKRRLHALLPRNVKVVAWDPACEGVGMAIARITARMGRWI